jgi:hypothetical protein
VLEAISMVLLDGAIDSGAQKSPRTLESSGESCSPFFSFPARLVYYTNDIISLTV